MTDGRSRVSQYLFCPRESRGALGSRALSHDSIFIPESGQDPARPVRVFSQENVCDRIKALQVSFPLAVVLGMCVKDELRFLSYFCLVYSTHVKG